MRSGLIACVLVSALALTGCTDSAEPAPKTQSSESAASSSSDATPADQTASSEEATPEETEPVPPVYPTGIDSFTEENAIKFADYFIEVINYATQTGDIALLDEYSGDTCTFCSGWSQAVAETHSEESRIENFHLSSDATPTVSDQSDSTIILKMRIKRNEYWIVSSDGTKDDTTDASLRDRYLALNYDDGKWTVYEMGATLK